MIIPRIGDRWKFRPSQGRHTTVKVIKDIVWRPSKVTGRLCPWLVFRHTPKARYIGDMRVKFFLEKRAISRVEAAVEHSVQRTAEHSEYCECFECARRR